MALVDPKMTWLISGAKGLLDSPWMSSGPYRCSCLSAEKVERCFLLLCSCSKDNSRDDSSGSDENSRLLVGLNEVATCGAGW